MSMTQCQTCLGTYKSSDANGVAYFHACAPIPNPAYQPDPSKPNFSLQQHIERPNKRDENLKLAADGKLLVPVSAGLGTQLI